MRSMPRFLLLLALFGPIACSLLEAPPAEVAGRFWLAIDDGDVEEARALSAGAPPGLLEQLVRRRSIDGVEVGAVRRDGERCTVDTRIGQRGKRLVFTTHLVHTEEGWRVEVRESADSLRRAAMASSIEELREGFREGADALGDAVEQGLDEAAKAMRRALDELEGTPSRP